MKITRSEGIVLRKVDYSEADRIMTVFTRESGKKVITAKGIRKSNKRDKYGTDILVLSDFVYYEKEEMAVLSAVELKEPFTEIKKDIKKINIAIYLLVVLNDVVMPGLPKKVLFDFVTKTLKFIGRCDSYPLIILSAANILLRIINEEGIMFEMGEGDYLNIEEGRVSTHKGERYIKINENTKLIINNLLSENREIVNYSDKNELCMETLAVLEAYMNYSLNMNINIKEYIKEAY